MYSICIGRNNVRITPHQTITKSKAPNCQLQILILLHSTSMYSKIAIQHPNETQRKANHLEHLSTFTKILSNSVYTSMGKLLVDLPTVS